MKLAFAALALASSLQAQQVQQPAQPTHTPPHHVIFSRSTDDQGNTTGTTMPDDAAESAKPTATDAERAAVRVTAMNLDAHLHPADAGLAVRAQLSIKNASSAPLAHINLQVSSTLHWERIRLNGREVKFTVATLNSDVDHTGQLHEATITPDTPLAPGATATVDVLYAGTVQQSARRLLTINTPEQSANAADWDRISPDFTGLRGFGNVVWYPVSEPAALLGDGARLFDEIGHHKQALLGTEFTLTLTVESDPTAPPTVAVINGESVALKTASEGAADSINGPAISGILTASTKQVLSFTAPSIFLAARTDHAANNTHVWTVAQSKASDTWLAAAKTVTPFLSDWLGAKPRTELTVLDLPEPDDAPFETGALLAIPVKDADPEALSGVMAHALTHAWIQQTTAARPAWLDEGLANFIGTLWLERQHGRDHALASLDSSRSALALMEPSSPGASDGQPLSSAWSPVYYRSKAAYVFWMLRDVATDDALQKALATYDPAKNENFEKVLEHSGPRADLSWFFNDWVDADKGLPDISIDSVYTSNVSVPGSKLVAVNLANNGYAEAEIPVTVRTNQTSITERVQMPARSKIVQRILIQGTPYEVQANDGTVPEAGASVHVHKLDETPTQP